MEEKERKTKLTVQKIFQIILVVVLVGVVQYYLSKNKTGDKEIAEFEAKYNKECPVMITNDIRMDSVNALPNNIVRYNISLIHIEKEIIDIAALKMALEKDIIDKTKGNPNLKAFRDNKYTLVYDYKDSNQKELFKITLTPEMY
jgi:hypothetical protein